VRRGAIRIGTSGYQYDHWRGSFHPAELPKRRWLEHYATVFGTLEINYTFYRLPSAEVFASWRRRAPPGFVYAVKMSRFATHMKKLLDGAATIARLLERAEALGETLGPVLVQLPPRWRADPWRLAEFLDAARASTAPRWAVEVRDASWLCDAVYQVLAEHEAALVTHDHLPAHPRVCTTSWSYLRFHGVGYGGSYADAQLEAEASWIVAQLRRGRDVYAYFNNDLGGHAPRDALRLREACLRASSDPHPLPLLRCGAGRPARSG
jgi:uncharacterized protein YecE (DUF72 family)